jgi:dienelactone hydrolase
MLTKKVISSLISIVMILSLLTANSFADFSSAIIRNDEEPGNYTGNGPYSYSKYQLPRNSSTGGATVYYPTGSKAVPPFSGIVYCPPYTGTQSMLAAWGPFFASHGIVLVTFDTKSTSDSVVSRAAQQRTILDALKAENIRSGSPLNSKLATDRIGAMGWSMGGGATWINSAEYPGLATAMTLAGHNRTALNTSSKGSKTNCPTLIMNGATDRTILGGMGQSSGVYNNIPSGIPKVIYEVSNAGHFQWSSPTSAGTSVASIALAFQKTFLDGDTRWAKYITRPSRNVATWKTANIPDSNTVPTPGQTTIPSSTIVPTPVETPDVTQQPTVNPSYTPVPTGTYNPQTDFSQKGPFRTTTMRMTNHTVYYPQSLGDNGMKHPVILWGNGTGATPSSYTGILSHLASYGFVVIAANTTMAGSGEEMIQGLDIMISENNKPESVFYNKINTSEIGATGHSQGGIGTVAAAMKDSRIVCSAPLMGTKTGIGSLKSPVLAIAGSRDTIVSPTLVKRIYSSATGTAVYAELQGSSHMTPVGISPSKEILNYVTAWFRLYLMNDDALQGVFFDSNSGINADSDWKVTSKNIPD